MLLTLIHKHLLKIAILDTAIINIDKTVVAVHVVLINKDCVKVSVADAVHVVVKTTVNAVAETASGFNEVANYRKGVE